MLLRGFFDNVNHNRRNKGSARVAYLMLASLERSLLSNILPPCSMSEGGGVIRENTIFFTISVTSNDQHPPPPLTPERN